jgi:hypothetical protein
MGQASRWEIFKSFLHVWKYEFDKMMAKVLRWF